MKTTALVLPAAALAAGKTVRIVNFKKPAADEMTVVFVHPADPARVPAEF